MPKWHAPLVTPRLYFVVVPLGEPVVVSSRVTVPPSFVVVPWRFKTRPFGPVAVPCRVIVLPSFVALPWEVAVCPLGPVVEPCRETVLPLKITRVDFLIRKIIAVRAWTCPHMTGSAAFQSRAIHRHGRIFRGERRRRFRESGYATLRLWK